MFAKSSILSSISGSRAVLRRGRYPIRAGYHEITQKRPSCSCRDAAYQSGSRHSPEDPYKMMTIITEVTIHVEMFVHRDSGLSPGTLVLVKVYKCDIAL